MTDFSAVATEWLGRLTLDYALDERGSTVLHHAHEGPLRVLQSLYPDGPAVCHNVLVHPPGGIVGGDRLELDVTLAVQTQALITTPGATRWYRSDGAHATQRATLHLWEDARLQWVPLESLAYSGCRARNLTTLDLAPGAELLGWDIVSLGLPHANSPFQAGCFEQELHWPGVWLERGRIDASDRLLMTSRVGLGGLTCVGTMFWLCGTDPGAQRRDLALDVARAIFDASDVGRLAGVTSPQSQVVVVRVLADQVEPVMNMFKQLRGAWLEQLWQQVATTPRIWTM